MQENQIVSFTDMNYSKLGEYIVLVEDVLNLYRQKEEIFEGLKSGSKSGSTYREDVRQLDAQIETKMQRIKCLNKEG